jgi:hypothetical protein
MNEQEREAIIAEIAKKRVVYQLPGMSTLSVQRDVSFRAASGAALLMDIYFPAPSHAPPPVVVIVMAYPDAEARVRTYGPMTSWAQLIAASGMAVVVYGPESPNDDVHALLRHLRTEANELAIDAERIGLFATSANVAVALATVIADTSIRCAALLYGYTMDLEGGTPVADAAGQFGFVNACAGKSPDDLPTNVPLLFVRAGQDGTPGLNAALDEVLRRSIARNLPISFINHATGAHGFDLDEPGPPARAVVQQVLLFLRLHLSA